MEKQCKVCGEIKPLEDFYRAAGMRDGHRNDCKACNLAAKARRYEANPQAAIDRARRWQQANRERHLKYLRKRRQRPDVKAREREGHLRRKFGLTTEQYEAMLDEQDGVCFLCRRPPREGVSLHVDHHHGTNAVRRLLCFECNGGLGQFQDDPELLRRAAEYLDAHDPEFEEDRRLTKARLTALSA